jgi:hypothetical protein
MIKPGRLLLVSAAVAAIGLVLAAIASAAAPQNTAAPTITGTAKEGSTLTATDGTWSNSPTSFTYQWQRCASDGTGCGDLAAATAKAYVLVTGDVGHTVRVVVTAANADGKASATSAATDVVGSKNGPTNSVRPALSGSAVVGGTLSVSNGTWSPTPSSFSRQWQRCTADGTSCVNIGGATGQTYGVRSEDVGHRLRALVTARTSTGEQTTADSNTSGVVTQTTVTTTQTTTQTTTTVVTTPAPKAPSVRIMSLRHIGTRIHVRFRVCTQNPGMVRITERDQKARALPYTRHLAVRTGACGAFHRSWLLLSRFRSPGRLLVTMRASSNGRLSGLAARSIVIH